MSDPFDSGTAGISLALDVPFPANVESGPGIEVDKTNGTWTVGLGYPPLVDGGSPANPSTVYLAAYDTGLQIYEKLRLDNIIAGATGLDSRTPVGDANYGILAGDRYLALTGTLTAVRTWTLPPAASVPGGRVITIQDEAGGISGQNHLNVVPTGADTIDGLANYRLKAKYGGLTLRSDGSSKWSIVYAWQVTLIADANYTVQQGDLTVAYTSITAPRIITLPLANAYPSGQRLTLIDFSGSCTGTNNIAVARAGADTINGATSQSVTQAYGYLALVSDGVSKWTIVDSSNISGLTISGSQIVGGAINSIPIGTTTPAAGAFTTLTATGAASFGSINSTPIGNITPGTGAFTTVTVTQPRTLSGFGPAINAQLNASVATNALTVTLQGADGNAPSATNPVYVPFRDPTIANGDPVWLTITAATTITAPSGATLGTANGIPFRLWVVAFNDAGTLRLGLISCVNVAATPTNIYPLAANALAPASSILIAAGSTSSQTFYTAGAGAAAKSYTILGFVEYNAGLATAGAYASPPTKIQLMGLGVPVPGQSLQMLSVANGTGSSTTSTTPVDVTGSSIAITPTSAANLVKYAYSWTGQIGFVAATNTTYSGKLVRGAGPTTIWGPGAGITASTSGGAGLQSSAGMAAVGLDNPQTSSAVTYKLQHNSSVGTATAQTFTIGAVVEEIMT